MSTSKNPLVRFPLNNVDVEQSKQEYHDYTVPIIGTRSCDALSVE